MEVRAEKEIRIFDLFISLCQRWRSLLICLVIGAVVFGVYGWYTSGNDASPAEIDAPADASEQEIWRRVLGTMEMYEVDTVYNALQECDRLAAEVDTSSSLSERLENLKNLTTSQNNILLIKSRFNADQKAYLAYLKGDEGIVPGFQDSYYYHINLESEMAGKGQRHISKKYIAVGALLGLILAAIVIIIKYIATATLKTAGEIEENIGLPIWGRFDGSDKFYDKRKTALDRWLRRVKQKNKQKLSYDESAELVAAKVQIAAEKKGLKKICFALDPNVKADKVKNQGFLEDIAAKVGSVPEVIILQNILGRSDALQDMAGADGVVLVLQTENSRFADVQYERLLCEGFKIPVLGTIVVE